MLVGAAWIGASVAILWGAGWATRLPASAQSVPAAAGLALAGVLLAVLLNVIAQQLLLCGYILQTISKRYLIAAALLMLLRRRSPA